MTSIVAFPTKAVRDWATSEKLMRKIISDGGASDSFSDYVMQRMKGAYAEFQFSHDISISVPEKYSAQTLEALSEYQNMLQEHTSNLLVNRLILEIELAIAQGKN